MTRLAVFVSTCAYIGFFPIAPGTVGSAGGVVVYLAARAWGAAALEGQLILLLFLAGVAASAQAEKFFGSVDPGPIVIDEVMGMLITLFLIPVGWSGLLTGFLLFRLCDIVKPFPASHLERLPGGFGVMADDAMAAAYANLLLRASRWLAPEWIS